MTYLLLAYLHNLYFQHPHMNLVAQKAHQAALYNIKLKAVTNLPLQKLMD